MSRIGIGLLNTWVSNNKLTLIEQLDSFLLCTGLKKKKKLKIQTELKITWHGKGMSPLRTHGCQWGLARWM